MTSKHLSRRAYALKAAFRRLVTLCGGAHEAARLPGCRVGKSQLQDYGSVDHPNKFPPIDVVDALEEEAGATPVSDLLIERQGRGVKARAPSAADLVAHGAEVQDKLAAFSKELSIALADGHLCPNEIERLRRIAELVELHSRDLHDTADGMREDARLTLAAG